jgi:hypothetical protein
MLVTKRCIECKKTHTFDLDITEEQWAEYRKPNRRLIQTIFPNLSNEMREFLITGIGPECWKKLFGKDE